MGLDTILVQGRTTSEGLHHWNTISSNAPTDISRACDTTHRWDREGWIKGFETARTEECYELEGPVPKDLDGTLFRNGHAKFDVNVRACTLHVC